MNEEYFDIYNKEMEFIGTEKRSAVHKEGFWHKSFQCWFVFEEEGRQYMLFQKRHEAKDTYPGLLDITSAGHLSAGERIEDGVREIKEELGLEIAFEKLLPLGVIMERKSEEYFKDNEFANVFLYHCRLPIEKFTLQPEEVTGIFKIDIHELEHIFDEKITFSSAEGYMVNKEGKRVFLNMKISLKDFVPHGYSYYMYIFRKAKEYLLEIKKDDK